MSDPAGSVKLLVNDNGTLRVDMTLTQEQAQYLKCKLELDVFEGASQEDLGFEHPENCGMSYDDWWESIDHPTETLYVMLVDLLDKE